MTKHEAAVVMAYTGIAMLVGDDLSLFYKYCEESLGYPVYTHELADLNIQVKLKKLSKPDFIEICKNLTD